MPTRSCRFSFVSLPITSRHCGMGCPVFADVWQLLQSCKSSQPLQVKPTFSPCKLNPSQVSCCALRTISRAGHTFSSSVTNRPIRPNVCMIVQHACYSTRMPLHAFPGACSCCSQVLQMQDVSFLSGTTCRYGYAGACRAKEEERKEGAPRHGQKKRRREVHHCYREHRCCKAKEHAEEEESLKEGNGYRGCSGIVTLGVGRERDETPSPPQPGIRLVMEVCSYTKPGV